LFSCATLTALAGAGCEDETPEKKGPVSAADQGEEAKIAEGKKLIQAANDALNDKKYDKARKILAKAMALGNESQRFEIEEAQDKVDKRQAKLWANEVDGSFKNNDCTGAFKQLAEPLKTMATSEAFTRELRHLVGKDALKCVQGLVDQKISGGAYADARKTVQNDQVSADAKKLVAEVEATILEALRVPIEGDLKARHWALAVAKIDAAGKAGSATEAQVGALLDGVREGVGPEISEIAAKAVGQRDAAKALKQVDQLAAMVRWAIVEPGAEGGLMAGGALPEALAKKREALAIWVEAQHLAMRTLPKPEPRWTHGKVQVFPASKADGPSRRDIPHGTQIWIVGASKDRALVTTVDPAGATLVQLLDKVVGWVPADRLAKENTADWLAPDDQLKGERVWGPLRPPDGMWELGTVTDVSGKDITVQRLADSAPFKLTRQKLRSGRLAPGTKVITFCVAKDQPAQVVEVPPTARVAKLKCDSGQEKDEDLASLRSKPELLPATK
jgi:hypothetical protein